MRALVVRSSLSTLAVSAPLVLALAGLGCASGGGRGPARGPAPAGGGAGAAAPAYAKAGLIVNEQQLPFTGSVSYFASSSPDSALVLVALGMSNRSLTFTGSGAGQRATYEVTLDLDHQGVSRLHTTTREVVRVASFKEAARAAHRIVFQQFITAAPGNDTLVISVRDVSSANTGTQQVALDVPRFGSASLSSLAPVFRATPRMGFDSAPALVANPTATVIFGRDSVASLYLEGYHLPAAAPLAVTVSGRGNNVVWRDTMGLAGRAAGDSLDASVLRLPIGRLGIGSISVAVSTLDGRDTVRTPLFVSFAEQLAIGSYDELLSYLRYLATPARLESLRNAPTDQRAAAWVAFQHSVDSAAGQPGHPTLRAYFDRVAEASLRFRTEGEPGWLSDRGQVFITLGEPDDMMGQNTPGGVGTRGRAQIWVYNDYHAQLIFVDRTGFGQWQLTPGSASLFQQVASEVRLK